MFKIKSYNIAWQIVGGLSKPSKMPCYGYGLPAAECKTGSKLRKKEGSVCNKCYAHRGNYQYDGVIAAQYRRLASIADPQWVDAMIRLIYGEDFFRFHDSGDIQNMAHLVKIVTIAVALPETKFWLPTKERKLINQYLKRYGSFPDNLIVRISATMVDSVNRSLPAGVLGSAVSKTKELPGILCEFFKNGGRCGHCRHCWDNRIANIVYKYH